MCTLVFDIVEKVARVPKHTSVIGVFYKKKVLTSSKPKTACRQVCVETASAHHLAVVTEHLEEHHFKTATSS